MLRNVEGDRISKSPFTTTIYHSTNHSTNWLSQDHHWRPRPLDQRLLGNRMVKQSQSVDSRQVVNYTVEKMKRNLVDTTLTKNKAY